MPIVHDAIRVVEITGGCLKGLQILELIADETDVSVGDEELASRITRPEVANDRDVGSSYVIPGG